MNVSAIGTDDGKNTYEIRRKWGEKGKKSLVIEMYPTIEAENCGVMDVSTMHLLNHVKDFGWNEMRIVNLYATVVTGKPTVNQLTVSSLPYIEEILEEEDISTYDIVIAWGNSLASHQTTINAKIDLLSILKEKGLGKNVKCITVEGMSTKTTHGVHPLYLGLHCAKEKWKLTEYPLEEVLNELEKNTKPVEVKKSETKKSRKKPDKPEKAGAIAGKVEENAHQDKNGQ